MRLGGPHRSTQLDADRWRIHFGPKNEFKLGPNGRRYICYRRKNTKDGVGEFTPLQPLEVADGTAVATPSPDETDRWIEVVGGVAQMLERRSNFPGLRHDVQLMGDLLEVNQVNS